MSEYEKHYHWYFTAFDGEVISDKIHWAVMIEVIGCESEDNARIAAKDIVTREHYMLSRVHECNTCKFQSEMRDTLNKLTN